MIRSFMFFSLPLLMMSLFLIFFFFNDTATTEIYTLSLHDALPISCSQTRHPSRCNILWGAADLYPGGPAPPPQTDRKSTRLNSSHGYISYAVFCLKKKKKYSEASSVLTISIGTMDLMNTTSADASK